MNEDDAHRRAGGTLRTVIDYAWAVTVELAQEMRWSFLPPLMVYLAAGVSGLTAIVGTFFVKEYLGLSAAFLAGLGFWAGLPWALKMPLGHLVDLIWRWKACSSIFGAGLIAASLLIMYGADRPHLTRCAPSCAAEAWYVLSVLLAPAGYVVQDVVADAMTVEAVPRSTPRSALVRGNDQGAAHHDADAGALRDHLRAVVRSSLLNIVMFSGVESMSQEDKAAVYEPHLSDRAGDPARLGARRYSRRHHHAPPARGKWRRSGVAASEASTSCCLSRKRGDEPNWWIFGRRDSPSSPSRWSIGLKAFPSRQEIVFVASMAIVLFADGISLFGELEPAKRARRFRHGALIIFVFRALPLPGPGLRPGSRSTCSASTSSSCRSDADHLAADARRHGRAAAADGTLSDRLHRRSADDRGRDPRRCPTSVSTTASRSGPRR